MIQGSPIGCKKAELTLEDRWNFFVRDYECLCLKTEVFFK